MSYTDEQIGYLRDALARYRDMEGRNLRPLPWKTVLDRVLMADVTRHEYPEDGTLPEFKEEALRRFALNMSVLSEDKLDDLRSFLTAEGYLQDSDMEAAGWSLPTALALSSLFTRAAAPGDHLEALKGEYGTVFRPVGGLDWVRSCHDLSITPVDGMPVAKVMRAAITFPHEVSDIAEAKRKAARKIHRSTGYCAGDPLSGIMLVIRDDVVGRTELINITRLASDAGGKDSVTGFEAAVSTPQALEYATGPLGKADSAPRAQLRHFVRNGAEGEHHG